MAKEVADISYLGFTTDIWSTDLNSCSLLSLTAHWLTPQFERKSAILHAQQFDGSHTGDAICSTILQMLEEWGISKEKVLLVICDNASNMIKELTDSGLPHYGCFAHTLQLVIHDAIFAQRVVIDLLTTSRSIVGHFRQSNLAYTRLQTIQTNLGLPTHRLVQDEPTRWNSTLYMLQRIIEQKVALAAYATEYNIPQLTANQLSICDKVIKVMTPIEEVTKSISADAAAISVIIPFVRIIAKSLDINDGDRGVPLIDPRFKNRFFTTENTKTKAEATIRTLLNETEDTETDSNLKEPLPKRPCTGIWKTFNDIVEESGTSISGEERADELSMYISEPLVPFGQKSGFQWWSENSQQFQNCPKVSMCTTNISSI